MNVTSRREPQPLRSLGNPYLQRTPRTSPGQATKMATTPVQQQKKTQQKRNRKTKPPVGVKLIVRLLPPSLEPQDFWSQCPLKPMTVLAKYYVKGHYSSMTFKQPVHSRAYVQFKTAEDADVFANAVKCMEFEDSQEKMTPVVINSLYEKIPVEEPKAEGFEETAEYKMFLKLEADPNGRTSGSILDVKTKSEAKAAKSTKEGEGKREKKESKKGEKKEASKKKEAPKPKEKKKKDMVIKEKKERDPKDTTTDKPKPTPKPKSKPKNKPKSKSNSPASAGNDEEAKLKPKPRPRKPKAQKASTSTADAVPKILKREAKPAEPKSKPVLQRGETCEV